MWTKIGIERLIARGEGQFLEFKKKANHPEKIVRELVAFANSRGGRLFLGVDDDGTASGSREIEGEVFVLEQAIKQLVTPKLPYTQEIVKLTPKKGIAIFDIPESTKKPHTWKDPQTDKKLTYIRAGDQSLKASREVREIIRRRMKPRDIQFNFGEKEKLLMELLDQRENITLKEFKEKARLTYYLASRTLVRLVLANVLDVVPNENEDTYVLKVNPES